MAGYGDKLRKLRDLEGYDSPTVFLEQCCTDSIVPGICMNDHCDATYEYEPDQDRGWCDECGTNTVKSALILAGMI